MLDPELKSHLETIEKELVSLRRATSSLPSTMMRGIFHGAGYVVGAAVIVFIIGWVLNVMGIFPAFSEQVKEFRSALDQVPRPLK